MSESKLEDPARSSARLIGDWWAWSVLKMGFRQQISYRRTMFLGAIASVTYALVRLLVLDALYDGRKTVGGLTLDQAITWAIFSGLLLMVIWVPWSHELPESIRSGNIVGDLLKPVHSFSLHTARQLGRMAALVLVRVLPIVTVGVVLLPVPSPNGAVGWVCLVVSLVTLCIAGLAYMYMVGATAFFTADYHVWMALAFYLLQLFGGMYVPLEYVPGILGEILRWGPGMAFVATPTRIINDIHPVQSLLIQVFWTGVFSSAAYMSLHAGRRKLVIYGG